ncbi:MAG TPA: hypothetical protein PKA82_01475 [Pyrinomonadaceae bacterium]|nr:hypothetical protein [Pyrinomonadaceae bacterium]
MSRLVRISSLFSLAIVLFTLVSSAAAQQWKDTGLDAGVQMAADFAVGEQAKRAKTTVTLNRIVKAQDREPKLGARDFMLCLDATVTNAKIFAQAVVTMDQYSNLRLMGWSKSTCGNDAGGGAAAVPGFAPNTKYKHVDINDAGADLAAQNAARLQSKKTKSTVVYNELLKAEDMEKSLGTRDFRLCMSVTNNGNVGQAQALIGVDQYSNYKLTSWIDGPCHTAGADGFKSISNSDAGMLLALDWAIGKHSDEKDVEHELGKVLKAESKGMFAMEYRVCFTVKEEDKTETIEAVITRDQYSNHKLVSWKHSNCK